MICIYMILEPLPSCIDRYFARLKRSRGKMKPAGAEPSPSTSRESWLLIWDLGKHTQRAKGGFRFYQACARARIA